MIHASDTDVEQLQALVREMGTTIYNLTKDPHLKAVVNSVFESISVEDTLAELRNHNKGEPPFHYTEL